MDDQPTGDAPMPMSDAGGPSSAEYESPVLPAGHAVQQLPCSGAECWNSTNPVECGGRAAKRPKLASGDEGLALHPNAPITPTQREVLTKVLSSLDPQQSSVVITNPHRKDNPIVYVTRPWENMCGFTYDQAVGNNPRLTQGERSDPETVRQISGALKAKRACKVMMLNYRGGLADRPFWNMLSISPIVHNGQLQLYLANLQDYTYHMSRLVSTPPTQFCRSAEYHQSMRPLNADNLKLRYYARPAILEADEAACEAAAQQQQQQHGQGAGQQQQGGAAGGAGAGGGGGPGGLAAPQLQMKRLGWAKLSLEPEHLADRVVDALHTLEARYERVEASAESDDVFVVNAEIKGVACRVLVTRDPNDEDAYRITCTRLGGDTFAYHDMFRQFRSMLGDAVQGGVSLQGARGGGIGGMRGGGGMRPALMPLGLAPLPLTAASSALPPRAAMVEEVGLDAGQQQQQLGRGQGQPVD